MLLEEKVKGKCKNGEWGGERRVLIECAGDPHTDTKQHYFISFFEIEVEKYSERACGGCFFSARHVVCLLPGKTPWVRLRLRVTHVSEKDFVVLLWRLETAMRAASCERGWREKRGGRQRQTRGGGGDVEEKKIYSKMLFAGEKTKEPLQTP